MRILAIDIGGLTQDILIFDTTQTIENCVKMIMPSPTFNLARKIRSATESGKPIFFTGINMGGGPSKKALKFHLESGLPAYSTPKAAATFDDDLDQVAQMGVQIVNENPVPTESVTILTRDLDLPAIEQALSAFAVDTHLDAIAVAVLDHGAAPSGVSDRVFRFQHLEKTVQQNRGLFDFAYLAEEIPDHLTRMKAVAGSVERDIPVLLMDTPVAAAIGAGDDPTVAGHKHCVIVNVGNFHTLAFHLKGNMILGFFEHHTRLLNTEKLDDLITRLVRGHLTNEEVYQDQGHGCLLLESVPEVPFVAVTGPQRHLMRHSTLRPHGAAPYGDMMLTGCFGLVRALAFKMPHWQAKIENALAA